MCFGPSPTRAHGWMKQPDVLQFLMNSKDRELPSCLWVLRHVNRRGIEVSTGSSSLSPFVCVAHLFWSVLSHGRTKLDEMPAIA